MVVEWIVRQVVAARSLPKSGKLAGALFISFFCFSALVDPSPVVCVLLLSDPPSTYLQLSLRDAQRVSPLFASTHNPLYDAHFLFYLPPSSSASALAAFDQEQQSQAHDDTVACVVSSSCCSVWLWRCCDASARFHFFFCRAGVGWSC